MRSRTSRGVPEWSRGEDLYIGTPVSAIGKVSGVIDIVPGPPEGSRGGPPGGATYPGGPHGLKWEGNQSLVGWFTPHGPPPAPRVGNPRGGGRPTWLGGQVPLGRRPPLEIPSPRAGAPLRHPIYSGGREVCAPKPLASPSPSRDTPPSPSAWRSPAGVLLHPPPRRCATGSSSTSLPPCWIKTEETSR